MKSKVSKISETYKNSEALKALFIQYVSIVMWNSKAYFEWFYHIKGARNNSGKTVV